MPAITSLPQILRCACHLSIFVHTRTAISQGAGSQTAYTTERRSKKKCTKITPERPTSHAAARSQCMQCISQCIASLHNPPAAALAHPYSPTTARSMGIAIYGFKISYSTCHIVQDRRLASSPEPGSSFVHRTSFVTVPCECVMVTLFGC